MWNISKEAFHRIFNQQLEQAMEDVEATTTANYSNSDIPICCVCDAISLDCNPLSTCSHSACPKCVAMARLHVHNNGMTSCRTCAETQHESKESGLSSGEASKLNSGSSSSGKSKNGDRGHVSLQEELAAASSQQKEEDPVQNPNPEAAETSAPSLGYESQPNPSAEETIPKRAHHQNEAEQKLNKEGDVQPCIEEGEDAVKKVPDAALVSQICAQLAGDRDNCTLPASVMKIQQALAAATKYSHCTGCLQAKKSQAPDLLCLDCAVTFCFKCGGRHKSMPSNNGHIMVPVEGRRKSTPSTALLGPLCPTHNGAELGMYCRNCEALVCRECIVDQHLDCPGIVSAQQYASEERDDVKKCRVQYAQVMRFFSEQRRDTEQTLAELGVKRQDCQGHIRQFFSALIKACMDVEGALLEELETSVSDHTDLLKEQSSAWLDLQECMQQLLDVTDVLHFLPTADFLPLQGASKRSLSQALREGESLAASAPPEMTLSLCLEQSSQRGVVKRIKEIGATALTVSTYNTLTLRKVSSVPFSAPRDTDEPLVTGMVLLTQTVLVAADFNNSCLKVLHREEQGDNWNVAEVFPLKWRPYAISKLSEKQPSPVQADRSDEESLGAFSSSKKSTSQTARASQDEAKANTKDVPPKPQRGISLERQSAVTLEDEEMASSYNTAVLEMQVAVSSSFAGCFIISVPVSGNGKMSIVRTISEEKGCWGLAVLDEHTLAISSVESGRSFISLVSIDDGSKHRLALTSDTTLTPLVSPRHVLATSPTSLLVSDHGKKAAMHVTTSGRFLFTFTGHINQRLSRPEGLCTDNHGNFYVADSDNHNVSVITKGGHLYSKTGSQESDLQCPQTVCMDRNSCLYVSNNGGKMLTVYDVIQ